ncbi:POU domain, class 6, transcription factor 2 isoform X2 [Helicoverpa armigera]|uniref:POU domain, class 6, transcription factor 2 isoform X2 n=2 Tax=Helicoverpa zea TaxID=7113 RepID=UPI001F571225|nr:POU domain, class 6, transcription factor 2 isoform X2 [Helicoverpa zea]XP_049694186.1 POU domain, class 6, transcription factor 2 isoform X2 [Helicoverpa armigera]
MYNCAYPSKDTWMLTALFTHFNQNHESGCEADMLEGAEVGRHSPPRPQQEPINLKNEAESDRESGASSPEGGAARAQLAEPRTPSPRARTPHQQPHLNGSMASMFQNLQNLANMQQNMAPMSQQLQQQMSQQMSQLAANLQGLSSMPSNPVINSPLNLSVSAPGMGSPNPVANNNMLPPAMPSPMPQLILASGQLVQGIQGAQLLIPTSQGIATQTILTIPVNHVNSNDQMVNLALNNGQVVSTSLANLQAMAQPHQLLNSNPQQSANIRPNMLNPTLSNALLNPGLPNFLSNGAANAQELLQALQQQQQQQPQGNHNLLQTVQQNSMPQQMQGRRSSSPRPERHYKERENFADRFGQGSRERNERENPGSAAMNSINRLAASNGEITITTSHNANAGPASSAGSAGSGPIPSPHAPVKMSPGSVKSPSQDDSDLLADSPNQPTISQSSSNVVDGINLEDIKEFAKAFKLRRLGLGLTQTQVGQALSVTEGPAYSQSAICSALASQMLAAQLSSQQQNIFEKLDITPKSAQKIKPVLERWMKEAEERYASGQNHLTDFIGMEPSKKRKRRTSFTPQALELLNAHFERNTHPSGTEITGLAHQLGYEREVIRIWFCNKRQALKNTVRMMSKGMV